jgi:hypothetical protein
MIIERLKNKHNIKGLDAWTFKINQPHVLNLLKLCDQFVEEIPYKIRCNLTGWRSYWETHTHNDSLKEFINLLSLELHNYIADVEIRNSWFAVYQYGDMAAEHNHGDGMWACVLYLDVGNKQSSLVVDKQGFTFEIGDLFVFPGQLNHYVPRTLEKRIVLVVNFKQL